MSDKPASCCPRRGCGFSPARFYQPASHPDFSAALEKLALTAIAVAGAELLRQGFFT
jgi:hypothetical protein